MGIQGLLPLMSSATREVNIRELSGCVAVVDGMGWLHRASYACADKLYANEETDQYVYYCLNRAQMLISAGIKPVLVFDGQKLPAKELTHVNRQMTKHNVRQRINLLLSEGNELKAKELMRSCVEVTQNMVKKLILVLREQRIDYIWGAYEADAQMTYLVNNGFADFVITEDSDLLVYNCRFCLYKLESNGNAKLIDLSLMNLCLGNQFSADKFRHMCILSGCDYLPNLPGIGLQKAKKFFKMTANNDLKTLLFKVPNYLKMSKRVKVTQEYVNNFIKADNTFKYQLVFCPLKRKLVPLMPYKSDVNVEELSYAGSYFGDQFSDDFAYQFAIGNVDINTLKIIDSYDCIHKCDSIWSKDWINYKKKTYSNKGLFQISSQILSADKNNTKVDNRMIESQNSDKPVKRLKVDENRFISCAQLLKEYSIDNNDNKTSDPPIYSSNQRTFRSRNIFKVHNESTEDRTLVQSKYFADIKLESNSTTDSVSESVYNKELMIKTNTSTINTTLTQSSKCILNNSQYSLNSSGNSTINSSFADEIRMSDTDRSEISETSDEEIGVIGDTSYTNIKSSKYSSIKRIKPLNITFTSKRADIRNYFK